MVTILIVLLDVLVVTHDCHACRNGWHMEPEYVAAEQVSFITDEFVQPSDKSGLSQELLSLATLNEWFTVCCIANSFSYKK